MDVEDKDYVYPPKPIYVPFESTLIDDLDNNQNWIAEVKKNGWRCMIRAIDKKISLWTRHRTIITDPLPDLRKALQDLNLPDDTILDGELLEHRSTTKQVVMVWGIIRWSGKYLDQVPYKEIRNRVGKLIPLSAYLMTPQYTFKNKKKFYTEVMKDNVENEGMVLKKLSKAVPFAWSSSPSINTWLKVKPSQ